MGWLEAQFSYQGDDTAGYRDDPQGLTTQDLLVCGLLLRFYLIRSHEGKGRGCCVGVSWRGGERRDVAR